MNLTTEQKSLHREALERSRNYKQAEWQLVQVLQKIDQSKLYRKLNCSSLFQYAVRELGFSESQAYAFILVARKALEVPDLAVALEQQSLTVSKAIRLVSGLNENSAAELVEFAKTHSSREIDMEVAKINPRTKKADRIKPIDENQVEITITISKTALEKFERVQALEAQRGNSSDRGLAAEAAFNEYLYNRDPVKKAQRVLNKRAKEGQSFKRSHESTKIGPAPSLTKQPQLCSSKVFHRKRVKLTSEQKHEVFARDQGRCTHIDQHGNRCETNRWLQIHHLKPVNLGGSNDPNNLTTLCSYHHDLAHQLSLPIDGQVTWLRSPWSTYGGQIIRTRPLSAK